MCDAHRRNFLRMSVITLGAVGLAGAALAAEPDAKTPSKAPQKAKVYMCPPCGCDNDGKDFPAPGPCTACGMPLIEKPEVTGKLGD